MCRQDGEMGYFEEMVYPLQNKDVQATMRHTRCAWTSRMGDFSSKGNLPVSSWKKVTPISFGMTPIKQTMHNRVRSQSYYKLSLQGCLAVCERESERREEYQGNRSQSGGLWRESGETAQGLNRAVNPKLAMVLFECSVKSTVTKVRKRNGTHDNKKKRV